MKSAPSHLPLQTPQLITRTKELATYLKTLTAKQIQEVMHISPALAEKTQTTTKAWNTSSKTAAIDAFIGDIYSGLRANELSQSDREYANETIVILSGLYGLLRPLDGIQPYRLEMGYRLPDKKYKDLYDFWGRLLADQLPKDGAIINTSSVEYTKALMPYIDTSRVITPKFLTINPKTNEPTFTTVHAKIARGAFARWIVMHRIETIDQLREFDDLGYTYDPQLSTPATPTYVCKVFGGLGLSMRLL